MNFDKINKFKVNYSHPNKKFVHLPPSPLLWMYKNIKCGYFGILSPCIVEKNNCIQSLSVLCMDK